MQPREELTRINLDDLVSSFGWQDQPGAASFLRYVFKTPARKFADMMLAFDTLVGAKSLPEGARQTLTAFAQTLQIYGAENVPADGPVIFLSNHPGMVDTLALFTAIGRSDLHIIALNRPFLQSLPNIARQLFFVSDDTGERLRAVKQAAVHLRAGHALLTFPAGQIEPDPLVYPGAPEALQGWTDSAGVFLRFAPETRIIPVLVSGVLWERAVKFPLTKFKRDREDREKLGAAFQLLAHVLFNARPLRVRVEFARPVTMDEVGSAGVAAIHKVVIKRMCALVQGPPQGQVVDLNWQVA